MKERVEIVGIMIDNITIEEGVEKLEAFLETDRLNMVFTPNSEMLIDAVKEREFGDILNQGQLVIPDGIGVVIASRFYKTPLKEKVAGIDLMDKLMGLAETHSKKVYLLGGAEGVAQEAADNLIAKYPKLMIAGVQNGYFTEDEEAELIQDINHRKTDILLVALGIPKQEKFIYKYKDQLTARIAMGVGGSFDVVAGRLKRAPEVFQKLGLEWFYRLLKEPKRFFRMLKLPKFIVLAFFDSKFRS